MARAAGFRIAKGFFQLSRSTSRAGGRGSGAGDGYWDAEAWEHYFPPVLEEQIGKAGNPGQEAILSGDFLTAATEYCISDGESFDPDTYQAYLLDSLGESKYNAISIIIAESAEELNYAWDNSFAGDGIGQNLYRD